MAQISLQSLRVKARENVQKHTPPPGMEKEVAWCSKCGIFKLLNEFSINHSNTSNNRRSYYCKKCNSERNRRQPKSMNSLW